LLANIRNKIEKSVQSLAGFITQIQNIKIFPGYHRRNQNKKVFPLVELILAKSRFEF
jgi:hypothetical protein